MKQEQGWALVPNKVINEIRDAVGADERTIRRVINGQPVRPVKAAKIQQALADRGYPFGEVYVPRKMRPESAIRPRSLGGERLTVAEREELDVIEAELAEAGISRVRPRTFSECPPDGSPCPWAGCRHHLAVDVLPNASGLREGHERRTPELVKLVWPDRQIDELQETCSLRVAARAAGNKPPPGARGLVALPVLSCEEVSRLMNATAELVRQIENRALAKLRAVAGDLA